MPLGLFFTKHPSQYFPLAAIAGCNDVRISIKFRPLKDPDAHSPPSCTCELWTSTKDPEKHGMPRNIEREVGNN